MKTKLTNEQVFGMAFVLKSKYPDLTKYDKRFNFAVSRTLSNIQPIAADVLKARETGVERFIEFEEKKKLLVQEYSTDGNFETDEKKQECQEKVNELAEEYKDALDERQKEVDIYNEILGEEVEVDIVQCRFEALPDDFDFDILRHLVKESDEEIEAMI